MLRKGRLWILVVVLLAKTDSVFAQDQLPLNGDSLCRATTFPPGFTSMGLSGQVFLSLTLLPDGTISTLSTTWSAYRLLSLHAEEWALDFRFPAQKDGETRIQNIGIQYYLGPPGPKNDFPLSKITLFLPFMANPTGPTEKIPPHQE